MTHWAANYIGEPWVAGEHDCWAFARRVWREVFHWEVPAVDVDALDLRASIRAFERHPERARWLGVTIYAEGDAILMGHGEHPHHVGVWCEVDGGGVLHAVQGAGVVFSNRQALAASGWRILAGYRRAC